MTRVWRAVWKAPRSLRHEGRTVPPGMPAVRKADFSERAVNRRARERLAGALEVDIGDLITDWRQDIKLEDVAVAMVGGNVRVIAGATGSTELEAGLASILTDSFREGVQEGAAIGLRFAPPSLEGVPLSFVDEIAASFIERQGAESAFGLTEETFAGIQETLLSQLGGALTPTEAAQQIGDAAGLNSLQSKAVARFREEITARLIPVPEADTPSVRATIQDEVDRFTARQVRARGALIADTEIQVAIQEGERAFYQVAESLGEVETSLVVRTWKTVFDSRVCPICLPLHNKTARFDEPFLAGAGRGFVMSPPAHPRCRCYITYAPPGEPTA